MIHVDDTIVKCAKKYDQRVCIDPGGMFAFESALRPNHCCQSHDN